MKNWTLTKYLTVHNNILDQQKHVKWEKFLTATERLEKQRHLWTWKLELRCFFPKKKTVKEDWKLEKLQLLCGEKIAHNPPCSGPSSFRWSIQIHANEISWMTRKQLKKHKRKSIRAMLDCHQMKTRTSAARLERDRRWDLGEWVAVRVKLGLSCDDSVRNGHGSTFSSADRNVDKRMGCDPAAAFPVPCSVWALGRTTDHSLDIRPDPTPSPRSSCSSLWKSQTNNENLLKTIRYSWNIFGLERFENHPNSFECSGTCRAPVVGLGRQNEANSVGHWRWELPWRWPGRYPE